MVNVANEMERRGMDLPLLIGGATTSRQHTAVRIAPKYSRETVHVIDASRVVGVVSSLLDPHAQGRARRRRTARCRRRSAPSTPSARRRRSSPTARRSSTARRSTGVPRTSPPRRSRGPGSSSPTIAELRTFIDWTFFFTAWELKGRYPKILDHPKHGAAARELFDNGQELLDEIAGRASCSRRAACTGSGRPTPRATTSCSTNGMVFPMLRQQTAKGDDRPNRCLADFIAPAEIGLPDHIGAFAVTAGLGADDLVKRFEAEHDDYRAIMVKALADRLAEAFAEQLHQQARIAWGYQDAPLPNEELVAEKYRGIRPAFGYPACPDHSQKRQLFDLLGRARDRDRPDRLVRDDAGGVGVAACTSRIPQSRYFNVGRIAKDQLEDYARRRGESIAEAERWLRPNLAYDTD